MDNNSTVILMGVEEDTRFKDVLLAWVVASVIIQEMEVWSVEGVLLVVATAMGDQTMVEVVVDGIIKSEKNKITNVIQCSRDRGR